MKHFEEVLKTLGAKSTHCLRESQHWTLWAAEYVTPVAKVTGNYLYLKASCPLSEATPKNLTDFAALSGPSGYQVVVTPSSDLAKNLPATGRRFRGSGASTTQQLLQDHLLQGVTYRPLHREEHFVPPSITLSDGSVQPDGLQFLSGWLVGAEGRANGPLAILTADGGNGKTTLARELCELVRARYPRIFPLLIESDQWKSIANTGFSLDTLWDIAVSRRLDNCSSLRANHSALRVLMQEGLLVVIFDGFDELAAASSDTNRPQEILAELQNLFTPEDEDARARILLTSRTTYWTAVEAGIRQSGQIERFVLNGFNNQQRKAYFDARLKTDAERDTALRLARQISGPMVQGNQSLGIEELNRDRLSGTPFVLALIAQFVEDNASENLNAYDPDPLEPLLLGVCRRENIRQDLKITPEVQIAIFEELFRLPESSLTSTDIDLILQVFDVVDTDVRQRFLNHFFLSRTASETVAARFEVLKVYFIARFLAKGLQKLYKATPEREIATTLSQHFMGESQVIEWLVWQLRRLPEDRVRLAIGFALDLIQAPENITTRSRAAISLSRLVLNLVTSDTKQDRATEFLGLMRASTRGGSRVLRHVTISGRVRSLDFTGVVFEHCNFVNVELQSCKFASSTLFDGCVFDGTLDMLRCEDIAAAQGRDNKFSPDAEIAWSKVFSSKPSEKVRVEFAEEALSKALKKFKGDYGFHSIQSRKRSTSINPRNPYNTAIWDALRRAKVTESHAISGVAEGGLNIREDKDLRREIAQYLDNGIVGPTLKQVLKELVGD